MCVCVCVCVQWTILSCVRTLPHTNRLSSHTLHSLCRVWLSQRTQRYITHTHTHTHTHTTYACAEHINARVLQGNGVCVCVCVSVCVCVCVQYVVAGASATEPSQFADIVVWDVTTRDKVKQETHTHTHIHKHKQSKKQSFFSVYLHPCGLYSRITIGLLPSKSRTYNTTRTAVCVRLPMFVCRDRCVCFSIIPCVWSQCCSLHVGGICCLWAETLRELWWCGSGGHTTHTHGTQRYEAPPTHTQHTHQHSVYSCEHVRVLALMWLYVRMSIRGCVC